VHFEHRRLDRSIVIAAISYHPSTSFDNRSAVTHFSPFCSIN
jgi:hypothetical protein